MRKKIREKGELERMKESTDTQLTFIRFLCLTQGREKKIKIAYKNLFI